MSEVIPLRSRDLTAEILAQQFLKDSHQFDDVVIVARQKGIGKIDVYSTYDLRFVPVAAIALNGVAEDVVFGGGGTKDMK